MNGFKIVSKTRTHTVKVTKVIDKSDKQKKYLGNQTNKFTYRKLGRKENDNKFAL